MHLRVCILDLLILEISALTKENGYALSDIIRDCTDRLRLATLQDEHFSEIFMKLADIELSLSKGSTEKIQIGAFIAVFQIIKNKIAA